ncbi:MAG TPA: hypothetical protein VFX03_07415, partial [Thermomicrobiales bacterium]|nr:hypothetical protein [Thermomicrobiales bacterium]
MSPALFARAHALALAAPAALLALLGLAQLRLVAEPTSGMLSQTTIAGVAFVALLIAGGLQAGRRGGDPTLFPIAMTLA